MEASVLPSQLIELGQQALTDVRIGVANGEPLVRCQVLASEFYESLKRALRAPDLPPVERWAVMAAANQCLHAADASISPGTVALELRAAVEMLSSIGPQDPEQRHVLSCGGLRVVFRELNSPSAARLLPFRLLRFLVSGATSWRISFRLTRGRCAARSP